MRIVHEPPAGESTTLASTVETADSLLSQARGLMFRRSIPADFALAFRFDHSKTRDVHMLFVPFPIDVVWAVDGVVERVAELPAWRGFARAEADLIVELPTGTAADVEPGDRLRLVAD